MYGVVVIKETNKIHGVVPNLINLTDDSIFGEDTTMEGINKEVCEIYAVEEELKVGNFFPKGIENHKSEFLKVDEISELKQTIGALMFELAMMKSQVVKLDV